MTNTCIGNCLACGKCIKRSFSILDSYHPVAHGLETRTGFGIAIDVGTTSIVLLLLNMLSGEAIARHSFMNPQRSFGADVISRIHKANNGKLEELHRMIIESLASGIDTLLQACEIDPEQVIDIVIAGNTVMTYLLLGFPCDSLGVFPFKPSHRLKNTYYYRDIFGASNLCCPIRIVPWLASFVGGDIMAGLLYVRALEKKYFLLMDLGTNGEMVLYHDHRLIVTSTAAGPAFEGGNHSGGASDVISSLASLVQNGFVDETGLLAHHTTSLLSQKDIRDLQLAKSAIRSGLEILLENAGIDYAGLDAMYLAGGIGQALSVNCAAIIGLLPLELVGRAHAVGNASLGGATRLLLAPEEMTTEMNTLLTAAVEINLANHPHFNDYFMEYISFPEYSSTSQTGSPILPPTKFE